MDGTVTMQGLRGYSATVLAKAALLMALASALSSVPARATTTIKFDSIFIPDTQTAFVIPGEPGITFVPSSPTFVQDAIRVRYNGSRGPRFFVMRGTMDAPAQSLAFDINSEFPDEVRLVRLDLSRSGQQVGSRSNLFVENFAGPMRVTWSGPAFDQWLVMIGYFGPRPNAPRIPGNAMVLDNFAFDAAGSPVPEPQSWALLLGGFSVIGAVMRRRPKPAACTMARRRSANSS
jgi:hypothetical protein